MPLSAMLLPSVESRCGRKRVALRDDRSVVLKPTERMGTPRILAETTTPDGRRMTLEGEESGFSISLEGEPMMHSLASASESQLGGCAVECIRSLDAPRILIGGLGLGFTLRSVLCRVGAGARIDLAELVPEIIAWNRTILRPLNGALLSDPRVSVWSGDVFDLLERSAVGTYDALVLDIDNGPVALVQAKNSRVYASDGLGLIQRALKPGGRATVWSAEREASFERRLVEAGFSFSAVPARVHPFTRKTDYTIYVLRRSAESVRVRRRPAKAGAAATGSRRTAKTRPPK